MAGAHYLLIDSIQQFRCKQAQVVFERLHFVLGLVRPVAVPQHLAQRVVLICQFVNPVEVRIQAQSQHAQHQDAPLLHSRATRVGVGLALTLDSIRKDFLKDGEDSLTQRRLCVDVLQPAQELWNIVTRSRTQVDRTNVHAIKQHLGIDYIAHGFW